MILYTTIALCLCTLRDALSLDADASRYQNGPCVCVCALLPFFLSGAYPRLAAVISCTVTDPPLTDLLATSLHHLPVPQLSDDKSVLFFSVYLCVYGA